MNKKVAIACSCLISACSALGGLGITETMVGETWVLASINDEPVSKESRVTLIFNSKDSQTGRVEGNASCNRYFGSYYFKNKGLFKIGPLGSTLMACTPPLMNQEQRFLRTLQQSINYKVQDDTLTIATKVGANLVFQAETEKIKIAVQPIEGVLPADATVKAYLQYVSDENARPVILGMGEVKLKKDRQNLFNVNVKYAPHLVHEKTNYSVSIRVVKGGRLIYTNKNVVSVDLKSGQEQAVEVKVSKI